MRLFSLLGTRPEGRAAVALLAADSPTTLETIRQVIRNSGFTRKAAQVTLVRRLVRADGSTWLEAQGSPGYRLTTSTEAVAAALGACGNGTTVKVQGEIPEARVIVQELNVTNILG